jgi:uncharacterized protein YdaU (DUF1376 family)
VNYYPHHIGDYSAATAHLTWAEDMAYTRLIRLYYQSEAPIPLDMRQVYRLIRASSEAEREAVDTVLAEFFTREEDGFHQKRCDEEIAKARESTEENEAKRRNERERQQRHRQRRKELFDALREYGSIPKWDSTLEQLETLLQRYQSDTCHAPVTRDITVTDTDLQRLSNNQEPITKDKDIRPRGRTVSSKRAIPDDWSPKPETVEKLSREFGLRVPEDVNRYVAAFRDACEAKEYQYADFDAAFRNCVRQDWPKFRANGGLSTRPRSIV